MTFILIAVLLIASACSVQAAVSDSVKITNLLNKVSTLPKSENKIIYLAKGFQGIPYAGGTLETFPFEKLVVRTDSVDCTTFVEYVLALYFTDAFEHRNLRDGNAIMSLENDTSPYELFQKALTAIRYRGGVIDGYPSRLHYFSEWIADNERKHLIKEVTTESPHALRKVDLNFMTEHVSLYPALAHDPELTEQMRHFELRWKGFQMPYIPKEKLAEGRNALKIVDGDIITIVTNIKGLDVVHVGFAYWINGRLHLLHASAAKKRVILDPLPLYEYSKNKKAHIGIRVLRICL